MKNILIINLKRHGDIISTSHLIRTIRSNHNHAQISLLVYEEFKSSTKIISELDNVFTLNRKEIVSYKKIKSILMDLLSIHLQRL